MAKLNKDGVCIFCAFRTKIYINTHLHSYLVNDARMSLVFFQIENTYE